MLPLVLSLWRLQAQVFPIALGRIRFAPACFALACFDTVSLGHARFNAVGFNAVCSGLSCPGAGLSLRGSIHGLLGRVSAHPGRRDHPSSNMP